MSDDITGDLDLLGDWLDAKGYGEESGLCTRAMDEINKLREERHELKNELAKWVHYWRDKDVKALSVENENLRNALRSILVCPAKPEDIPSNKYKIIVPEYVLQEAAYVLEASCKAAAALKETGDANT